MGIYTQFRYRLFANSQLPILPLGWKSESLSGLQTAQLNPLTMNTNLANNNNQFPSNGQSWQPGYRNSSEKLAQYMVSNGMVNQDLATKALQLVDEQDIAFDEALLFIENQSSVSTSSKSHISGKEAALLRNLVDQGKLTCERAAEVTRDSLYLNVSAINILCKMKELTEVVAYEREAVELLECADVSTPEDQYCSKNWQLDVTFRPLVVLIAKGLITKEEEEAALECALLVREDELSSQEAKLVLRLVSDSKISVTEALAELGLTLKGNTIKGQIKEKLNNWFNHLSEQF